MVRQSVAVLLALTLLAQQMAYARQGPPGKPGRVEISWQELENLVIDQKIALTLPDGTRIKGSALAVRPESLVLVVSKSSLRSVHPLGQTEIPRASVSEIRILKERNSVMRIAFGVCGAIGGIFAVGALAYASDAAGVIVPGLLLIIPMTTVAGYYLGKMADSYSTRLLIKREAPPAPGEED
jgi:hypothetical protein